MNLKTTLAGNFPSGMIGAAVTVLLGIVLFRLQIGEPLSYDLPFVFVSQVVTNDVIMIKMDEQSHREMGQVYEHWDRSEHARLLDRLKRDRCQSVVFDVYFADQGSEQADKALADAIKGCGNVVLTARIDPIAQPGVKGDRVLLPREQFAQWAAAWGIAEAQKEDADDAVRRHYRGTDNYPSLAWAAAIFAKAPLINTSASRRADRWLRYYGPYGTIPSVSYYHVKDKPPGFFQGKIVVIGGQPRTRFMADENDEFRTPYTRWDGDYMSGMEVTATTFLNLVRGDWLTRLSAMKEVSLLLLAGLIFGYGLSLVRPLAGVLWGVLGVLAVTSLALWLFWRWNLWFSWVTLAGFQIPCALVYSVIVHAVQADRKNVELEKELSTRRSSPTPLPPSFLEPQPQPAARYSAVVPDHTLLRCVGKGAYGEVWLARNAIGTYHAVKLVYRYDFASDDSYARELKGIQKYMPVSLKHPGLVHILHAGRNDEGGYYYCIMEAGDDETAGPVVNPETYSPRNLAKDLRQRGRLPVHECVAMILTLADALDFLHEQRLIHRDIKPSNIIFVNGVPKLADIGLVTEIIGDGKEMTRIGTDGYIAPEGPGTAAADIYSLGKVMYEASMGRDRQQFPELPTSLGDRTDEGALLHLNTIILKACEEKVSKRYQSARQLRVDLLELQRRFSLPAK